MARREAIPPATFRPTCNNRPQLGGALLAEARACARVRAVKTAPDLVEQLRGAVATETDLLDMARLCARTAWRTDADDNLIEPLPAPAGVDEASRRNPERFGLPAPPGRQPGGGDDGQQYWADQARGELPAPIGELAAKAIEHCQRTTKTRKLIPGAVARRALEEIGQSAEWAALRPSDRSMALTLLSDGAEVFPGVVRAALGTAERLPAPLADEGATEPASFADVASVHIAPIIAANILYGGKLGLMHGPAGGGKTTVLANAVARITRGTEWLGRPTIKGHVLVVTEDRDTWKDALETAGADQAMVHPVKWRDLTRKVADLKPVAVVIDTMQYIASVIGSGELDSAREVDIILRPLEKLCRDNGVGIITSDHEPWSDGSGPTDAASGTKKRPRHSGAKVATCDYILRCSVDHGVTTIRTGQQGAPRHCRRQDRHGRSVRSRRRRAVRRCAV